MPNFIWAGLGPRSTPAATLSDMTHLAASLSRSGCHLATGAAPGAHTAFAAGVPATQRTRYHPPPGFPHLSGADSYTLSHTELAACMDLASSIHPSWYRCSPAARIHHARTAAIMLGPDLSRPVDALICWTPNGAFTGRTAMGLRIAADHGGIPVTNLGSMPPRKACQRLREILSFCATSDADGPVWKSE